jgi:hypothetical protein
VGWQSPGDRHVDNVDDVPNHIADFAVTCVQMQGLDEAAAWSRCICHAHQPVVQPDEMFMCRRAETVGGYVFDPVDDIERDQAMLAGCFHKVQRLDGLVGSGWLYGSGQPARCRINGPDRNFRHLGNTCGIQQQHWSTCVG